MDKCRFILAVLAAIQLSLHFSNGIIILNSGNPSRFIRGAFMDVNQNQPQFTSSFDDTEVDLKNDEGFIALASKPGFMQFMAERIVSHLDEFNKGMTEAMIVEAKEVSALSCLNMCQFARARMTALDIMNNLQSIIVSLASLGLDAGSTSATPHVSEAVSMFSAVMPQTSANFNQMGDDLSKFDISRHGESPMLEFAQALKEYGALKTALELNQ